MNTCLIGLSIDSNASHLAWLYDIYCKTGIRIPYPIIADRSGEIARKYGMISSDVSNTETIRNVYVIDDKGIIRTILVYPMQIGRCIPEILRIVEALQISDKCKGLTPANWVNGNPLIQPMPTTFSSLEKRIKEIDNYRNGMSWYLSFKDECEPGNRDIQENKTKKINEKNSIKDKEIR